MYISELFSSYPIVPIKCEMKLETKYTETEQNEMKRNEIYQNETKRDETK